MAGCQHLDIKTSRQLVSLTYLSVRLRNVRPNGGWIMERVISLILAERFPKKLMSYSKVVWNHPVDSQQ